MELFNSLEYIKNFDDNIEVKTTQKLNLKP